MSSNPPRRRRSVQRTPATRVPGFTPAFQSSLAGSVGLAAAPAARRRAFLEAVRRELSSYHASTFRQAGTSGTSGQRAAISELLRAAEALLRALGDMDERTAAVLTGGPDGIDTAAWARDLHGLWNKLLVLDRQHEAQEHLRAATRHELERVALAGLTDAYRVHAGKGGDLLAFLRQACACVSLPLPPTDEKLIAMISALPTLA